jgi:hypothetical protein
MGRIVYSFSVPEHSVADQKLKAWKVMESNISAMLCMLIENEGDLSAHNEALKRKILRLKDLTNARKMTLHEWNEEFMMW